MFKEGSCRFTVGLYPGFGHDGENAERVVKVACFDVSAEEGFIMVSCEHHAARREDAHAVYS